VKTWYNYRRPPLRALIICFVKQVLRSVALYIVIILPTPAAGTEYADCWILFPSNINDPSVSIYPSATAALDVRMADIIQHKDPSIIEIVVLDDTVRSFFLGIPTSVQRNFKSIFSNEVVFSAIVVDRIQVCDFFCHPWVEEKCGSTKNRYVVKLSPQNGSAETQTILGSAEPGAMVQLLARVYDQNDKIVPNARVQLQVNPVAKSGGHDHDDANRPKGSLGGPAPTAYIVEGNTGQNGFSFTFTAPEVAGDYKIIAKCTDGKNCPQQGADTVWVGLKGLIPLQPLSVYVLIAPNADDFHPNNHFMSSLGSERLAVLAALYNGKFPNDPVLYLNDASLERGGLFDISAKRGSPWTAPHRAHRLGTNIDVRANPESNPTTAIPSENFEDFEALAQIVGGTARLEYKGTDNQHYHLSF